MKAIEFLKSFPYLPSSREGGKLGRPSNSELRRWLEKSSVQINGERLLPGDEISYPIFELIFFPCAKTQVTMKQI